MKKITEKDTPNFLLWTNPYLKKYTKEELVNSNLQDTIVNEDKIAEEKWTEEVIKKFLELDNETQKYYFHEAIENANERIYGNLDKETQVEFENKEEN